MSQGIFGFSVRKRRDRLALVVDPIFLEQDNRNIKRNQRECRKDLE